MYDAVFLLVPQLPRVDLPITNDITPDMFTYVKMKFPQAGDPSTRVPAHNCGFDFKAKVASVVNAVFDVVLIR